MGPEKNNSPETPETTFNLQELAERAKDNYAIQGLIMLLSESKTQSDREIYERSLINTLRQNWLLSDEQIQTLYEILTGEKAPEVYTGRIPEEIIEETKSVISW